MYGEALPIKFVMEGYNIISGSHVDKYVVDYTTYSSVSNLTQFL